MKSFCCYWEGAEPPSYLAWCVSSWAEYVDLDEILFLNHSNVSRYLGDLIDLQSLRRFSFPKQSDIVSAAFLYKYGGLFLDIDSVLVNEAASPFFNTPDNEDVFRFFGNEAELGVHIGVIGSPRGGTVVSRWQNALFQRVTNWDDDDSWSYVGNSILQPMINDPSNAKLSKRLDVVTSLATPELAYADLTDGTAREKYERFWFTQPVDGQTLARVAQAPGGIISLHNSWTPASYARLSLLGLQESDSMLSSLLKRVGNASLIPGIQERIYYGS
ncbi:hypothetical protein ACI1US_00111 [Leucobacter sp. BZR 635]